MKGKRKGEQVGIRERQIKRDEKCQDGITAERQQCFEMEPNTAFPHPPFPSDSSSFIPASSTYFLLLLSDTYFCLSPTHTYCSCFSSFTLPLASILPLSPPLVSFSLFVSHSLSPSLLPDAPIRIKGSSGHI